MTKALSLISSAFFASNFISNNAVTEDYSTGVYVGVLPDTDLNYYEALAYCEDVIGSTLASIHSSDDNDLAQLAALNAAGSSTARGQTLIGFNDLVTEDSFEWTDGSTVDYTNWQSDPVAPNNFRGQDCVVIEEGLTETEWNDLACDTARETFVCNFPMSECGGCGTLVVGAQCSELTTNGNIYACPSEAATVCRDGYHVCSGVEEVDSLGVTTSDCDANVASIGTNTYLIGETSTFVGTLCCNDNPILPTPSPTDERYVSQCNSTPCNCVTEPDPNCRNCQPHGDCSQCFSGYFRISTNHPCASCQDTLGHCKFCNNFSGCGQCENGYTRTFDTEVGIWYCQ